MKKAVIFYASIGSGHYTAALALQAALCECAAGWQVILKDVFPARARESGLTDLLSALSTTLFARPYTWAWHSGSMAALFRFSARLSWTRQRVLAIVRREQPDVVICTHALPCAILSSERQYRAPLLAVSTDLQVHAYWPSRGVDGYAVGSPTAAQRLAKQGAPAEKIRVLGVPVRPDYARLAAYPPGDDTKKRPTRVLLIAGGGRNGPYLTLWPRLLRFFRVLARQPLQGVEWRLVFGSAHWLRARAERLLSGRADVTIFGMTHEMPVLMQWADLVVTKPGGLTVAEAIALSKPVILLKRGAGQEFANTAILTAAGAGRLARGADVRAQVARLAQDGEDYARMRRAAAQLARPASARDIAAWAVALAGGQD